MKEDKRKKEEKEKEKKEKKDKKEKKNKTEKEKRKRGRRGTIRQGTYAKGENQSNGRNNFCDYVYRKCYFSRYLSRIK